MINSRAIEVIRNVLETASYDVEEGNGLIDLSAYFRDECLVIMCSDDPEKIVEFNKKTIRVRLGEGTAECGKLLFTMNDPLKADNCVVWGHSELSKYAGQAAVAYVLGESLSLDLRKSERRGRDQGLVTTRPTLADYGPEIPLMASTITEERARQIAGVKGEICRIYLPHYLYSCTSRGEKQYKTHILDFHAEESGLINAVTGTPASLDLPGYDKIRIDTKSVPVDSKVLKPEKEKTEISEEIVRKMKEKLTKNVRISKTEGDTIFYEDIEVAPDDEDIELRIELVYLPVVQVRGNKIVEIETFSGNVLKEPVDDGVELL